MREIKFRAWDKKKNQWGQNGRLSIDMYGNISYRLDEYDGNLRKIGEIIEDGNERFILEQYTGLKDKNGTEIYEGDKVQWEMERDDGSSTFDAIVEYQAGAFYPICEMPSNLFTVIGKHVKEGE